MTLKAKQGHGKTNCHFVLRNRKFLYFVLILFDKLYVEMFAFRWDFDGFSISNSANSNSLSSGLGWVGSIKGFPFFNYITSLVPNFYVAEPILIILSSQEVS